MVQMGHQVKLMPGEFVKAFNIRNKNDAADARAIWLAVQQPGKAVAVKTEMQQAMLALHRAREQLVKFGTMQINGLRGLLAEYGEVSAKGRASLDKAIPEILARVAERYPTKNSLKAWCEAFEKSGDLRKEYVRVKPKYSEEQKSVKQS